jgi:ketosteroid isomerase-like protein
MYVDTVLTLILFFLILIWWNMAARAAAGLSE